MKPWAVLCVASTIAGAPLAETTLYGEANATLFALSQDAGTSMQIQDVLSYLGYSGSTDITNTESVVFDLKLNVFALGRFGVETREAFVGVEGDYGRASIFFGRTPVAATNAAFELMERDPVRYGLALGGGSGVAETLPLGLRASDGVRYASGPVGAGLSFDTAIVPAEDPNGVTGFGMAARLDRPDFRITGAAEINVEVEDSQLVRLVGEYDIDRWTLGALWQGAANIDTDVRARSAAGFVRLPVDYSRRDGTLQLLVGVSNQDNDADTLEESQVYGVLLHRVRVNTKVSAYGFAEVYRADAAIDGDFVTLGGGVAVTF